MREDRFEVAGDVGEGETGEQRLDHPADGGVDHGGDDTGEEDQPHPGREIDAQEIAEEKIQEDNAEQQRDGGGEDDAQAEGEGEEFHLSAESGKRIDQKSRRHFRSYVAWAARP